MDQSFLTRARRMLGHENVARLDHDVFLATVTAQQSASATAQLQARAGANGEARDEAPIVELLTGGPSWRSAASRQSGCFSRATAGRGDNGS